MKKDQILEKLKTVNYPGFNRDIVSFGMVKEIVIDRDIITIMLSFSSKNEEKKEQLIKSIIDTLNTDNFNINVK